MNNSSVIKPGNVNAINYSGIIWYIAILTLMSAGAFVFGRYICQPKKSILDNTASLQDAISRCKEESDQQNVEVKIITNALTGFNHESLFLIEQNQKKQGVSKHGFFHVATEKTTLLGSRDKEECKLQLAELIALMEKYPESGYRDSPCIETVELYIEARKVHHDKIVSLASVLLPNLDNLMNTARSAHKYIHFKTQSDMSSS